MWGLTVATAAATAAAMTTLGLLLVFIRVGHRRIRELSRRIDELSARLATEPAPAVTKPTPRQAGPASKRSTKLHRPSDHAPHGPTLITVPDLARSRGREPHGRREPRWEDRFVAIGELADGGATPVMIARATGLSIGRVELILGLRRRAQARRADRP